MTSRVLPFLAGLLVAGAIGVILWLAMFGPGARLDLSRPVVVQNIQRLQRLETVVYSVEKIVTGTQDSAYLPRALAGDRILLIVYGEVTAGIDLGKLDTSSIAVRDRSISLQVPPAEIFSTRIDNAKTQVYSRETGLFVRPDPNLETIARRAAEQQVHQAAVDSGILKTAADNGRMTLQKLLEGLGFESVVIR
jgi:uncharacterized protein DUF4230